jgi:hypothetical protein
MIAVLPKFFSWYYVDMIFGLLKAWKNFLLFNMEYFSIPTLLGSLFSHWHKYYSPYGKIFEFWKNIESFVFNMMSRVIGGMMRIALIIIGLILELIILIAGIVVLFAWIILPALLVGGFLFGFKLLFF